MRAGTDCSTRACIPATDPAQEASESFGVAKVAFECRGRILLVQASGLVDLQAWRSIVSSSACRASDLGAHGVVYGLERAVPTIGPAAMLDAEFAVAAVMRHVLAPGAYCWAGDGELVDAFNAEAVALGRTGLLRRAFGDLAAALAWLAPWAGAYALCMGADPGR